MLRIDDNPVARYPEFKPLEEDLGCWSVAHVKSRQEKAFAHDLVRAGIPYYMYMPLVEKRTRRRDNNKIRKSLLPLFPGYIAIALPWDERDQAYKTHRLANMIPVEDQALFVKELDSIRQALESECRVELAPTFQPGQPVRVTDGPMLGMEGEVVQHRGETMFVIRVNMFQQAIKVELDETYLEAR